MKGNKHFYIRPNVFPFDIMVSIEESDKKLIKRFNKYGFKPSDYSELLNMPESTNGRCVMLPSNQTVIRLKIQPTKHQMAGVISHEVFHAVSLIMELIGMPLKVFISCEAYAYLTGFITEEIYKNIEL
jgi:hypothetical protein